MQHHPCSWRCTERAPLPVHATGDYWPGESESLLANMGEEARLAGKKGSKGGQRGAKNTKGKRYGAGPATTDAQLMEKLGDTIQVRLRADICRRLMHGALGMAAQFFLGWPVHAPTFQLCR